MVDLPPEVSVAEPLVIDLPLVAKARVSIDLESDVRVGRARFAWRRLDAGSAPPWSRVEWSNEWRFRFDLPPSRYEVTVSAGGAPGDPHDAARRDDAFLITVEQEIEVPERGCEVRIPVAYGGRVRMVVTRADGRFFSGVANLTGSAGRFLLTVDGREVKESDNLPAGSYLLRFPLPGGGQHEQAVEIERCRVTDVRIRVP